MEAAAARGQGRAEAATKVSQSGPATPAGHHLLHATRADLLRRLGSRGDAAKSYTRALALVSNQSERRFLERRLRELG